MTISVALCVYNGEKFLQQQLDSIIQQTLLPDEIVICDDASKDNSVEIVKYFKSNNTSVRCKTVFNSHNIGYNKNFEQAIALSSGDIIFLCDQDDIWQPGKIETVKNIFNGDASVKGVFSNAFLINDKGEMLQGSLWDSIAFQEKKELQDDNKLLFDYVLKTFNVVTGACLAFKKEVLPNLLPLKPPADEMHDEYIALKLAANNQLLALDEKLIGYRIHDKQEHGVPDRERWHVVAEMKRAKFNQFYSWNNSLKDVERLWRYITRANFYLSPAYLYQDIVADAHDRFIVFKRKYLDEMSFFKRKKTLLYWFRKGLYNTKWWHVLLN